MRIVVLGSGSPMATASLAALARDHEVLAAVIPRGGIRFRLRTRRFRATCREHRIPLLAFDPAATPGELARLAPELLCVATFPFILKPDLLATASRGAINLHPSLLPRHRGVDPIFWTYFDGDAQGGVTVHWMDERVDAGDVIAQVPVPVERGLPMRELYARMSVAGAALLAESVARIEDGTATRSPQDESLATHDPPPRTARYDWQSTERTWHVLHAFGKAKRMTLAPHDRPPGTIEQRGFGQRRLYCADGWLELDRRY
jgi:methionyl-tRNA formyltransferase